ncbi:MAG: S41 family peptidase [Mycobacteriales bacterium]
MGRRPRGLVLALAATVLTATSFAAGIAVGLARGRAGQVPGSVLDQAANGISREALVAVPTSRLDAAAIQAMLSTLDDRWAAYYGAGSGPGSYGELRNLLDGRYCGLGVWLRRDSATANRQVVVANLVAGSPAAVAGLQVGDVVLDVDGQSVSQLGVPEVVDALRGAAGTWVHLVVRRGSTVLSVSLQRSLVPAGDVTADPLAPGVLRIRVADFSVGVGAEVAQILAAARQRGLSGVVLDLRGNPGGLLSEAVALAGDFLSGGPVVTLLGRSIPTQVLDAPQGGDVTTPLVVLVDGGTASAAEVVAGALQDRGRAVLVGSRTFGKGSVQEPIQLSDGSAIEVTVAHYRTPSGRDLEGVGLQPDISVPASADPSVALDRAVQVIDGLATAEQIHADAVGQG